METLKHEISKRSRQNDFMLVCIISDEKFLALETLKPGEKLDPFYEDYEYFWHPDSDCINVEKLGAGAARLDPGWKSTELCAFEKYFNELKSYKIGMYVPASIAQTATTKSGDVVACLYRLYRPHHSGAVMVMLPPLSTPEASVGKVLEILGTGDAAPEPAWSQRIALPGTRSIAQKILLLEKEVAEKNTQIQTLEKNLTDKRSFTKLLYGTGSELEDAVFAALKMLGLEVKLGDPGREDLVMVPSVDASRTCHIEIKGTKNKIKRDDLRQLGDWVDRSWSKSRKPKGILIVNMHRLSDIKTSKNERSRLPPDQLEYAQDRKFCIVPTYVLFDLCIRSVDGHATDLPKIEQTLIDTVGFVKPEDLGLEP